MVPKTLPLCVLFISAILIQQAASQSEPACATTDDCPSLFECVNGYCAHKALFPLTIREIITVALLMLVAGPAHGLGAGSVLTPILLIGFNMEASKSTMIMYALILGGSIGTFLNAFWRKNPKTGKPVIDYDVIRVIMPLVLLGVNIGVVIKIAAPQIVIILGLLILEVTTVRKLLVKVKEQMAREKGGVAKPLLPPEVPKIEGAEGVEGLGNIEMEDINSNKANLEQVNEEEQKRKEEQAMRENDTQLQSILREDHRLFPPTKFFWILGLLAWIIGMTVLRSGPMLGIDYCGPRYWGLFVLQLAGCFAMFIHGRWDVGKRCEIKRSHGITSDVDFLMKPSILAELAQVGIIAGGLAGFMGIGAGIIMSPYLLAYGCPPGVLGPTISFGIVQSSFIASAVSLILYQNLNIIELLFFFGVAVLGSYFVQRTISFFVGKFGKPSISLWIMISITMSSIIIMPIYAVWRSIEDPAQMLKYRWIC
jgi:uncharacterized membrane protein YfcA